MSERGTSVANLLQGLAQCAAAALKLQRGEMRGARSLASKGTRLVEAHAGLPKLVFFAQRMRLVFEGDAPSTNALPSLLTDD